MKTVTSFLPRGNLLDDTEWASRHRLLQWLLAGHLPALFIFGVALGHEALTTAAFLLPPLVFVLLGRQIKQRRVASVMITAGLTYCSVLLVGLSRGSIEAHFHFFIIIGFIALYQDWVPFLWNVAFTVLSHAMGTIYKADLIFSSGAAQRSPWLWSGIHGGAVLAACVGMVLFWRVTEDEQRERRDLSKQLTVAERRRFTSQLLVNLARRNQSMLYRQLEIINEMEDRERDPDALAELFQLDHLATRVRRNAESLLVLSGEQPARVWRAPVALHEVIRAAIAETEDLDRVDIAVDERVAVAGHSVTDLTHLLAELTENAVRFSPPHSGVTIRSRVASGGAGGHLVTIEDWGVGMPADVLTTYNQVLADPPEVDLAVPQQLGFHVVARLAERHHIEVSLTPTPGGGLTAAVLLSTSLVVSHAATEPTARNGRQHRVDSRPNGAASEAPARSRHAIHPQAAPVLEAERADWVVTTMPKQVSAPAIETEPRRAVEAPPAAASLVAPTPVPLAPSAPGWSGWWTPDDRADRALDAIRHEPRGRAAEDRTNGPAEVSPIDHPVPYPRANPPRPRPGRPPESATGPEPGSVPDRPRTDLHAEDGDGEPRLNRRVPQTHLAPELRVPVEMAEPVEPARTSTHPLTSYQANRNAAAAAWADPAKAPEARRESEPETERGQA
ncbi:sensor histidine kinase [Pseudonocardia spinosispora]|uniref:sensor histidine kinase n=1 Tax=Pseudonocardia spinosispora TaxID=103441 RepID=UPI000A00BD43|nr:ATP-binding protein [Pseudonocardia spinosispora]